MNYKYLFLGVVSLAALSCVREPATDSGICPGREPEAVADDGSVISGWIRIKLQEDAALRVALEAGQNAAGVHVVEQLASELEVELVVELADALQYLFALQPDI